MLRLGMVDKVEEILNENPNNLRGLESSELEKFIKLYLNHAFDAKKTNPFLIFQYLEIGYLSIFTKDINKILIESKYFNSMPSNFVLDALIELWDIIDNPEIIYEDFIKFLITKINDPKVLLEKELGDLSLLFDVYSGLGLEEKLLELNDMQLVSSILDDLEYSEAANFLKIISKNISKDEFKSLCLDWGVKGPIEVIFDIIFSYSYETHEEQLDYLFDIMTKNKIKEEYSDNKKVVSFFERCLREIKDRKFKEEDKNYLAKKLIASKNYAKMLEWVSNIDCEANKGIIDVLIGNITEFILLYFISEKYIPYALTKILEQGRTNNMGVPTRDAIFYGEYNIERLNLILDSLYDIEPNIKFSKDITIKLLKRGVNKFASLIFNYDLSYLEKMEIFDSLTEIKSDWLIVYGSYLLSGNEALALKTSEGNEALRKIKARKKTKTTEEM